MSKKKRQRIQKIITKNKRYFISDKIKHKKLKTQKL